jgi:hypothetical protein
VIPSCRCESAGAGDQLFYSFNLEEVVPAITWYGRLLTFLIYRGFGRSWRHTILRLADHRLIRC